ncbi:MAG TPA: hypothetical protein VNK04_06960 [Gemmataceae bacterium]|nr:hypothetical protein [Gemmataceae bacterium]
MKRYLLLLVPVSLATALAWAEGPAPSAEAQRAEQLRRNRGLIRMLVEGGLSLAGEEDPVRRAEYCNNMAERLAGAIKEATQHRDSPRMMELGRHLRVLLERGVAPNLSLARGDIPEGSADEMKLHKVRDHTARVVGLLEEEFRRAADAEPQADMREALDVVQAGRYQVDLALKAPGRPKAKAQGPNRER